MWWTAAPSGLSGRTVVVSSDAGDQLQLTDLPPEQAQRRARAARKSGPRTSVELAENDPIARVAVDIPLAHLDRLFDYAVTDRQSADAQPGVRVRVRFSGQLVDGYILERSSSTDHAGRLTRLSSVVSPVPVLRADIASLARAVADRYAGSLADVLRLAIPPRHASVEREHLANPHEHGGDSPPGDLAPRNSAWSAYRNGVSLVSALASGTSARAAWCALPGVDGESPAWVAPVAEAVHATRASRRGSIVVVPDHGDVEQVERALAVLGVHPVVLTADLGPRERYRRWLSVLDAGRAGSAPAAVVGTRAAVYAPVNDLGLVVVWDDGNDLHAEPRAPYPHVREVAALRAHQSGCALIVGAHARTAEAAAMVESGFVRSIVAERSTVRASAPQTRASADAASDADPLASAARLPTVAWRAAHDALTHGPVLIQVPRRGYLPSLACASCRESARCLECQGPLAIPGDRQTPVCQWCGSVAASWRCPTCGGERLRSHVVGARRTAEELGRAFPGVTVLTSGGRTVRATVPSTPSLVVATPGAEPIAPGGYSAALLLDAWALLGRVDLRAAEETLRRWMAASALVRSASESGHVVVVADASIRAVQALVRWDPVRFAEAELAERDQVGLPPARRVAVLQGAPDDVDDLLARLTLPDGTEQLGPVPVRPDQRQKDAASPSESRSAAPQVRVVLRATRRSGNALAAALAAGQGERSVRKESGWVTVRIDPVNWG
jgi:primosomal protein N' (replication factor Y)